MKKIKSLYLALLLILINAQNVYATTIGSFNGKMPTGDAATVAKNFGGIIITIASYIGSMTSIVVLVILGIKYMAGSAEQKSEYKSTMIPYFIGAITVFGATAIANLIYKVVTTSI